MQGHAYAEWLRVHGDYHHIGKGCYISRGSEVPEPWLVSLGDNVWLADCSLLTHDASVIMLAASGIPGLSGVGRIVIGNNVFIGRQAIIMRNVTIGGQLHHRGNDLSYEGRPFELRSSGHSGKEAIQH